MSLKSTAMLACLTLFFAACTGSAEGPPRTRPSLVTPSTTSNVGGDGFPAKIDGEDYHNPSVPLTGTMVLQKNGCWHVDLGDGPRLVVFPHGTKRHSVDGSLVVLSSGEELRDGSLIDGTGGIVGSELLPGQPNGYWGGYITFCGAGEVVVFDSMTHGSDPANWTDEEIMSMLDDAELTVHWGCGLGFSVSTEDQRVAIVVMMIQPDLSQVTSPIELPDPDWFAEVQIGKNLMANHCDDVFEGWEPTQEFAARLPIMSGTLDFEVPGAECDGTQVAGLLSSATFSTPGGGTAGFGDIELFNRSFSCYAG